MHYLKSFKETDCYFIFKGILFSNFEFFSTTVNIFTYLFKHMNLHILTDEEIANDYEMPLLDPFLKKMSLKPKSFSPILLICYENPYWWNIFKNCKKVSHIFNLLPYLSHSLFTAQSWLTSEKKSLALVKKFQSFMDSAAILPHKLSLKVP